MANAEKDATIMPAKKSEKPATTIIAAAAGGGTEMPASVTSRRQKETECPYFCECCLWYVSLSSVFSLI